MSKLSLQEQETIIVYNKADPNATVYTHEASIIKTLTERKAKIISEQKHSDKVRAVTFEVPKGWVAVRPKRRSNMTEEQKAVTAERLKESRKKTATSDA